MACPGKVDLIDMVKGQIKGWTNNLGGLAHMVERSLSMREAPRSILGSSTLFCLVHDLLLGREKQKHNNHTSQIMNRPF